MLVTWSLRCGPLTPGQSMAGTTWAIPAISPMPAAPERLIEDAIRDDPCSPLRWISRSQRHLVKALSALGFQVSQRVVANLLRERCGGLVSGAPERPCDNVSGIDASLCKAVRYASDFLDRPADEL